MHASPPRKSVAPETATALPLLALILANVALAFGPWLVRVADTSPVASAFWRVALATPILIGAALTSGWRPSAVPRALWWLIALGGLGFAADLGSWNLGILRTTLANATLFGNSATLLFPLYGFLVTRTLPTWTQGVALALAIVGAMLLLGRSSRLDSGHLVGDLFSLTAGVLYTLYLIVMTRVRATMAPLPALAVSTAASVLPLLVLGLLLGEKLLPTDWTPLIGLALVSQVFGQGLMIYALGRLPPLVVGLTFLIQPVIAGTVGWMVYDERLGFADLVGAVLVAVALVLVSRRPRA